uniref:ethanolamine kinase n=1 Tax=Blastobotrys adeninivorans TaxID=409370 RepID=A0A060T0F3_BLAAD
MQVQVESPPSPHLEAMDVALDFSDGYDSIRDVVSKFLFKGFGGVRLDQLKGGITNVLLKGSTPDGRIEFLIRAYGRGTSALINRDREYETHVHLLSKGLAPPLYARFQNGLVYGFISGKPVRYQDLSHPTIVRGVSSRLAQWHAVLDAKAIDSKMTRIGKPYSKDLYDLLDKWLDVVPEDVLGKTRQELRTELEWFKGLPSAQTSPVVVAHCDLLSGNILVPEGTDLEDGVVTDGDFKYSLDASFAPCELVKFIDYEYTMPAPRAFDLANHFMEWQGFDCVTELIPDPSHSNPVLRFWCYNYLSSVRHYGSSSVDSSQPVTEKDIDELIDEVRTWWGMPGFYWGIWAAVQSTISDIDFDYASYARSRLSEYYAWKNSLNN